MPGGAGRGVVRGWQRGVIDAIEGTAETRGVFDALVGETKVGGKGIAGLDFPFLREDCCFGPLLPVEEPLLNWYQVCL